MDRVIIFLVGLMVISFAKTWILEKYVDSDVKRLWMGRAINVAILLAMVAAFLWLGFADLGDFSPAPD